MARRLFFVPQVHRGIAELEGEDAKHLTRVLRVEPGQTYQLSDNESLYLATVEEAHKSRVSFRVVEKSVAPQPKCRITLAAALVKFDHFEWSVEKATELGVARIVPVQAARSEAGLERAAAKRVERWRKIALEAAQQSRRTRLPEIAECLPFAEAIQMEADLRLFADEEGGVPIHEAISPAASVAVAIGPEGGWTDAERAMAENWTRVSLGPHVLRSETAALAALSVVSSRLL